MIRAENYKYFPNDRLFGKNHYVGHIILRVHTFFLNQKKIN